jgi:hypothetical protein
MTERAAGPAGSGMVPAIIRSATIGRGHRPVPQAAADALTLRAFAGRRRGRQAQALALRANLAGRHIDARPSRTPPTSWRSLTTSIVIV